MKLIWGRHSLNPNIPLLVAWKTEGGNALDLEKFGVFTIKCTENNYVYVGWSTNIQKQYELVSKYLEQNLFTDVCQKLQDDYNIFGKDKIHFTPHEICQSKDVLTGRWQHWMNFQRRLGKDFYEFDWSSLRSKQ